MRGNCLCSAVEFEIVGEVRRLLDVLETSLEAAAYGCPDMRDERISPRSILE